MEIKIDIKKAKFEKELIREIAKQILDNRKNSIALSWNDPVAEIMKKKAFKLLKEDKEFDKELRQEIKKQLKSKSLIRSISEERIKERLRYDD